ncbi:MAG: Holliday junction branch migration protein RuvA [Treponemataceae bacterium]|nr:Holliday junction branch migration protein RuvA [Treponemataceae bacterium]
MINSLFGTITGKLTQTVYIETSGGIEWELIVSESTLNSLPSVQNSARVYTYLQHKDDSMKLFGFSSIEERSVFLDLLKVEGVGPKAALKILSAMPYTNLVKILEDEDLASLEKVQGVGKKTAQKMMLALKGKLSLNSEEGKCKEKALSIWNDIIIGLVDMGYDKKNCEAVVEKLASELDSGLTQSQKEEIIFRKALMELS